jgi:hypothetical protein
MPRKNGRGSDIYYIYYLTFRINSFDKVPFLHLCRNSSTRFPSSLLLHLP